MGQNDQKNILVTAFEPFGGETMNPTEMILNRLPDMIGSHRIRKVLLPVEFERASALALNMYDIFCNTKDGDRGCRLCCKHFLNRERCNIEN